MRIRPALPTLVRSSDITGDLKIQLILRAVKMKSWKCSDRSGTKLNWYSKLTRQGYDQHVQNNY